LRRREGRGREGGREVRKEGVSGRDRAICTVGNDMKKSTRYRKGEWEVGREVGRREGGREGRVGSPASGLKLRAVPRKTRFPLLSPFHALTSEKSPVMASSMM